MATNLHNDHDVLGADHPFAELLDRDDVTEICELRSRFGFMAFHGGFLEEVTDDVAITAAERAGASVYAVLQPDHSQVHIPSHQVTPEQSPALEAFLDHVDVAVAVHGYGRAGYWASILLGGRNRDLAGHIAVRLLQRLRHYEVVHDIDAIPRQLRGLHPDNPINRARGGGVQIELPPRVRGRSPLWHGHRGPARVPHLEALIDGLAAAAASWETAAPAPG